MIGAMIGATQMHSRCLVGASGSLVGLWQNNTVVILLIFPICCLLAPSSSHSWLSHSWLFYSWLSWRRSHQFTSGVLE